MTPSAGSPDHLDLKPKLSYTGGERGWIGDSPFIFLDCHKIRALGWKPKLSIERNHSDPGISAGERLVVLRGEDDLALGSWLLALG